ncbi:MAG: sugar phosphate nucleotidyltransferase [Acidobacteriota bacterium]
MQQRVEKAVITAAGLGTRLLSVTKEMPKEMLPLFSPSPSGSLSVKPLLQLVFEQLHSVGIREFCFVVGRGKRAIEDHFTPDPRFLEELREKGKETWSLESFYAALSDSAISWVNQESPRGFGDAVLRARHFVGDSRFLVAAGDTYITSDGNSHLKKLMREGGRRDAVLTLLKVEDPSAYGVAVVQADGTGKGKGKVLRVVEKPSERVSDLAIMPFYSFTPAIFDHLSSLRPGVGGEVQLTDAVQSMISSGMDVGYVLLKGAKWMDVGNPSSYWEALRTSMRLAREGVKKGKEREAEREKAREQEPNMELKGEMK